MRGPFFSVLARRSWWWIFGLLIALPAATLALLGLRAIRTDDSERREQSARQHVQVAGLTDTAFIAAFDRVRAAPAGSPGSLAFEVDSQRVIALPADRVFAGPHGARPAGLALVSGEFAAVPDEVVQAQAAYAQRRLSDALALYGSVRDGAALRPWVELQRYLIRFETGETAALDALADERWAATDARSPGGVPLAVIASSYHDVAGPRQASRFLPLLHQTRRSLQSGRWWLSIEARRSYDTALREWLTAAGAPPDDVGPDARLADLTAGLRTVQTVASRLGDIRGASFVRHDGRDSLVIMRSPEEAAELRQGILITGPALTSLLDATVGPLLSGQTFTAALLDESGVTIWGTRSPATEPVPQPLASIAGVWLSVDDPALLPSAIRARRMRNYALVIVPMVVLACGLAMTVWIVRRELALARQQSEFVASVTHEFKSPLTGIRLLMERVSGGRGASVDAPGRYYAAIGAETARLEGLVNRLLEAQKLQAGQREYRFQSADVAQIVTEVVARMQPQAEARAQRLHVRSAGRVPDLRVDREAIADAFANLVDNALKYSPPGTEIAVDVDADDREVRIAVADRGVGIDAQDAGRIFEPFYRSARGDQASVQGTGLGLALVKAAAEAHGGSVSVASNGGQGSRFTLRLPVAPLEAPR